MKNPQTLVGRGFPGANFTTVLRQFCGKSTPKTEFTYSFQFLQAAKILDFYLN